MPANKVTISDIQNVVTNGETAARLVNDLKLQYNNLVDLINEGEIVAGVDPLVQPTQFGDGITTVFDSPAEEQFSPYVFMVYLDGFKQDPNDAYTVDVDGNIVFSEAPPEDVEVSITLYSPRLNEALNTSQVTAEGTAITKTLASWTRDIFDVYADASDLEVTATGTTTPRTLGDRFADVINVKDFESLVVGDDWTNAIKAALNLSEATGKTVAFGEGEFLSREELDCKTIMRGAGEGKTRLVFDQSSGVINGIYLNWDEQERVVGVTDMTIVCKDGNGGKAIYCEKGEYFINPSSVRTENLEIMDYDGPDESVSGFITQYAWAVGCSYGDIRGLRASNIRVYGNYDITATDTGQFQSTGFLYNGDQVLLFPLTSNCHTNACRIGISLQDHCFGFWDSMDITRSWIGIDVSTDFNWNEVFFSNIGINAQSVGINVDGFVRMHGVNIFINRHSSSFDGDHDWFGMKLVNVSKSYFSNIQAQPASVMTEKCTAFYLEGCESVVLQGIAGVNINDACVLNNCTGITGSLLFSHALGDNFLRLESNTRCTILSLVANESYTGTWYTHDGSIDFRNISLNITSGTSTDLDELSISGPSKFIDKLCLFDKDIIGDKGWVIQNDNGDFRLREYLSGVETNKILINSEESEIDLRFDSIKLNAVQIFSGSGSPEGVVSAAVGSLFLNKSGSASTSMYVKESGTGNTGWVAK